MNTALSALSDALLARGLEAESTFVKALAEQHPKADVEHLLKNDKTPAVQWAGVGFYKFREAFCVGKNAIPEARDLLMTMRDLEETDRMG